MLKMSALAAGAVLLVSLFLPCAGYAAQEPSQAILPAATGDEILTRLPNGLSVYIIRDKRFPLVCTRLYVRTGSANEDARQAGISHVLEHMVFKGTEQRPKGQVAKDVEARGGYLNAATSFDQTYYLTDMPASQWRMGMDVVKDMAFHALLDPEELESEKKVIISELEGDDDTPRSKLFESLQTATLKNTPYGRPIIGYKETINAVTVQDLRAYIDRWYQPQNMLLLVAGDIDPREVLAHAQSLFGDLHNRSDLDSPASVEPATAPGGPRVEVVRGPWNKVYVGVGFPAPALSDARSVQLDVLSYLLGGDGTSLLQKKYRYEKQLVENISAGNMSLARAGLFLVSAQLDAEKLGSFMEELVQDLARLDVRKFGDDALTRARFNLADSMDRAGETLNGLASWRGTVQFELGGREAERNLRLTLNNVDTAQLEQARDLWLRPERLRIRILAPQNAALPDIAALVDKAWPVPPAADSAKQAAVNTAVEYLDLGNGRTLILQPDPAVPYVAMTLMMSGGNALLSPDRQGLANLTAATLKDGSGNKNAQSVERFFAERAASLSASAGLQTFNISLTGPSRFNADYCAALKEMLEKPRFEDKEVRREARLMMSALRQRQDNPVGYLFSKLNGFLYPGHVYGYDPLGTADKLAGYTRADVRAFWEEQSTQPWVLSVAGTFDRDAMLAFARTLPRPSASGVRVEAPRWGEDRELDLRLPGRNQAYLVLNYKAVPRDHADAPALMLLQSVLSGQSGLLFNDLRDEQGLGYTVTALYRSMPETGSMLFYIGTTPEKVEQARAGFARVIASLRDKEVSPEQLQAALNRMQGSYYRERQSLGSRAGDAATDAVLGNPRDFQKVLLDKAAKLTPADVQDVARRYLVPEGEYDALLRP